MMKKEPVRLKNMKLPQPDRSLPSSAQVILPETGGSPEAMQLVQVEPEQVSESHANEFKPVLHVVKKKKPPVPESWRVGLSMAELHKLSHKADW